MNENTEIEIGVYTDELSLMTTIQRQIPDAEIELRAGIGGVADVLTIFVDSVSLAITVLLLLNQIRSQQDKTLQVNRIVIIQDGNKQRINAENLSDEAMIEVLTKIVSDVDATDAELSIYRKQNANLMEIMKLEANRPINLEIKAVAENQSNSNVFNNNFQGANITNFSNQIKDYASQQGNQYNYISPEKQTLSEAAAEIQLLLKQLEETNPSAIEIEQIDYVNSTVKPDLKKRTVAALKAAGDTAIDEFFLENKYLKIGKAIIKAWLQPNN